MIKIWDFGWKMEINFEYICKAIADNNLRALHYKFANMRKLYRLILKYGDQYALNQMEKYLLQYPTARRFFEGERI